MAEPTPPAEPVPATAPRRGHPVLVYTLLRLGLLVVVWLPLQLLTPLRGVMAILVALLLSGIVSFLVLDRQRDAMSAVVGGVFRRIDERIERSRTAEDLDLDPPTDPTSPAAEPAADREPPAEEAHPADPPAPVQPPRGQADSA